MLIESIEEFDNTFSVKINKKENKIFSKDVVKNLLVAVLR